MTQAIGEARGGDRLEAQAADIAAAVAPDTEVATVAGVQRHQDREPGSWIGNAGRVLLHPLDSAARSRARGMPDNGT